MRLLALWSMKKITNTPPTKVLIFLVSISGAHRRKVLAIYIPFISPRLQGTVASVSAKLASP